MTKATAYNISKWLLGGFLLTWSAAQIFFYLRYRSVDLPGLDFAILAVGFLFVFWRAAERSEEKKEPAETTRGK